MKMPLLVGTLATCLVVLSPPPSAEAAQQERKAPRPGVFFAVEGSGGYSVFVVSIGNWAAIETQRKRVTAAYAVPAKVSADSVEARFGSLGRIDVAFESLLDRPRNPCRGPSLEIGIFRGRIDFRGENGYTRVKETRTIGFLLRPKPLRCGRRPKARSSAAAGRGWDTRLTAIARQPGAVTSFELSRKRGSRWVRLLADREERRGRMRIYRSASTVVGGENAFLSSGPGVRPPFAFVAAPKPLSGSAVFDAAAAPGSQWTGNLAAWMPGAGR